MTSKSFLVLQIVFSSLGAISGAITSYFAIRYAVKTPSEEDALKDKFKRVYTAINIIPWGRLPEEKISWLLGTKTKVTSWIANLGYKDGPVKITFYSNFLTSCLAGWFLLGWTGVLVLGIPVAFLLLILTIDINMETWPTIVRILLWVCWLVPTTITMIVFLKLATIVQLGMATILTAALIPVYAMAIFFLLVLLGGLLGSQSENMNRQFKGNAFEYMISFSAGCAISFSVTLAAMLIGHAAQDNAWVPQRISMLISNVLFDGLTLITTLFILEKAIKPETRLSIPIAIVLDVLLAAAFACSSLWFGLRLTEHPIALRETLNILCFHSIDGSCWEIGPLCWTMHTTFIPTILYLSFILLCYLAKLIYRPVNWVFYHGKDKNPYGLTIALCTLITGILWGISGLFGQVKDMAKLGETEVPTKTTVAAPKASINNSTYSTSD